MKRQSVLQNIKRREANTNRSIARQLQKVKDILNVR